MQTDKNLLYSFKAKDGSEHSNMQDVRIANDAYMKQYFSKIGNLQAQGITSEEIEMITKCLKNAQKIELTTLFESINIRQVRVSEWQKAYQKFLKAILTRLLTASEVVAFAEILKNANVEIHTDLENELYLKSLENLNIITNKLNSENEQKRK